MSYLVFDPEQYELRGLLPEVFTSEQKNLLNRTVSRVQGQLDWNAQMLGFSGPSYWGVQIPSLDGSYQWSGLPETAFEKKSLLVGTFGVYNRNLPYEQRPLPFNRQEIKTSADQTFSVHEHRGETIISPYGYGPDFNYRNSPYVYQKAIYTFEGLIEVEEEKEDPGIFVVQDIDQGITQVEIDSDLVSTLTVRLQNSTARPFIFFILPWEDISDWVDPILVNSFLGVWGSKGNELSLHFAFDALNLHGFNEEEGLQLEKVKETFSLVKLLEKIGLTPTPTFPITTEKFRFWVEGCESSYSPNLSLDSKILSFQTEDFLDLQTENGNTLSLDDGECSSTDFLIFQTDGIEENVGSYDNGDFDDSGSALGTLDNGLYPFTSIPTDIVSDGGFSFNIPALITTEEDDFIAQNQFELDTKPCYKLPDPKIGTCLNPNYRVEFFQNLDNSDLLISPDPGPEPSLPIGCNGVSGLDAVDCGIDNKEFDLSGVPDFVINNGTLEDSVAPEKFVFNGFYDQDPQTLCEREFDFERNIDLDSLVSDVEGQPGPTIYTDLGSEVELTLIGFDNLVGEFDIGFDGLRLQSIDVTYEAFTTLGKIEFPIIEWEFDLDLNNGIFGSSEQEAPIVNADDGDYSSELRFDEGYVWDEGSYDGLVGVLIVDQGILNQDQPTCRVDNGHLIWGQIPYIGPEIIEGNGSVVIESECITYDNGVNFVKPIDASCELDNGSDFDSIALGTLDEGNYNKGLIQCLPCGPIEENLVTGPVPLRTLLNREIFSTVSWKMAPSVKNAESPLRVWKNRVLTSDISLIADQNNGAEDPSDLNYFIRLPLEYRRDEKFWKRSENICRNFGYFGQNLTNSIVKTPLEPRKPKVYGDSLGLEGSGIVYYEPYLTSSVTSDFLNSQGGFTDSRLTGDQEITGFTLASISDYDPSDSRVPNVDGKWKGSYYYGKAEHLTGHFSRDLLVGNLTPIPVNQYPIWDMSDIIYPEVFPPELEVGKIVRSHKVSYAYFMADFSTSDDPVFDPEKPHCHRNKVIKGKTELSNDFGIVTEAEDQLITTEVVEISELKKESQTAYLLHY